MFDNKDWEITIAIRPMILFGYRSYELEYVTYYAFYFAFIDLCLTVYEDESS